eukprot:CAMPEP_0197039402 /NCGR_PEP_ID=MMETSP1384-20130603/16191_1 /TAXON_ID=29189 /ORGANISM="Ammonia sp." /LENGTH=328 /DNA_ID=CAMNT_0042469993 /DNA_START=102 /DNA_END=1088 /DNA_ORIENTATION=-
MQKEHIISFARELDKAVKKSDATKVLSILTALSEIDKISIAILKQTALGKKINNLRKLESFKHMASIRETADILVQKWKAQVNEERGTGKKKVSKKGKLKNGSNHCLKAKSKSVSLSADAPNDDDTPTQNAEAVHTNNTNNTPHSNTSNSNSGGYQRPSYDWQTGNERRDTVIKRFMSVLKPTPDREEYGSYQQLAAQIEQELIDKFGLDSEEYPAKYRDLHFNIKKNNELKLAILEGDVKVTELLQMNYEQMASKELKKKRDTDKKWAMEEARNDHGLTEAATMTDEFKCGKCNQRKCKYSQAQTRSADEPMTTFVTCLVCGNRWKF